MAQVSIAFESLRSSEEESNNFYASRFDAILSARAPSEIPDLLREIETATREDYFAFGFLAYEAGFIFLPAMPETKGEVLPLAWFALTKNPERTLSSSGGILKGGSHRIENLALNRNFSQYAESLARIRRFIERGDTYQVNYTLRYRGDFRGSVPSLYEELVQKQRVSYAALIQTEEWSVLSLSPELFFRKKGKSILMRPMKGTAPRGRTSEEDRIRSHELRESPKEQAENLMIVDMLRNDLGKICETGSVEVARAFEVERYETLLQMTSTILGKLRKDTGLSRIFEATFPSGSITGAPKIRTMQIIHELEEEPRGIYTGAIGYVHKDEAIFSVAIRTVFIDHTTNRFELGVGSGVLHEADAEREYRECQLKANFLTVPQKPFELIETILWIPAEGFRNLPYHMDRLFDSAEYFLFSADRSRLEKRLRELELQLRSEDQAFRIRLLLDRNGELITETRPVETIPSLPVRIRFARSRQDSTNSFLFHKTTNRSIYDEQYEEGRREGFFDVIFSNELGEITEGAISNIFIRKHSRYYTPPISSGLLAGTFRRQILEKPPFPVEEKVLYKEDLQEADEIFLTNAIRGMLPALLSESLSISEVNSPA